MIIVDDIFIGVQPGTYSKVAIAVRDGHYCVVCMDGRWIRIRRTTKPAKGSALPNLPSWNAAWNPAYNVIFPSLDPLIQFCKNWGLPEYAISEAVALML